MAITKIKLNGTTYTVGDVTTEGPQCYDGVELPYSWDELHTKVVSRDFSDLRIGDYKTFTLNLDSGGYTIQAQIAGINTYYLTYDTGTPDASSNTTAIPSHIDFISVHCMGTAVGTSKWQTSNNNNGSSSDPCPYMTSQVKSFLSTVSTYLPSDLSQYIVSKTTRLESRYSSSGTLTDGTSSAWKSMGYCWLPSEVEILGTLSNGTRGYGAGQDVQYPLFENSWTHLIKCNTTYPTNGTNRTKVSARANWWTSSVCGGSSTHCLYVSHAGMVGIAPASTTYFCPLCFRFSAG